MSETFEGIQLRIPSTQRKIGRLYAGIAILHDEVEEDEQRLLRLALEPIGLDADDEHACYDVADRGTCPDPRNPFHRCVDDEQRALGLCVFCHENYIDKEDEGEENDG